MTGSHRPTRASQKSSVEPDWTALAADLGRDGYVMIPGMLAARRLDLLRGFAQKIALAAKADYPDADMDVGFAPESPELQDLIDDPPAGPLLEHFLGKRPTFINAWQRVSLPHSKGGVWHQDLQRNIWPPALNVAIYLDEVTELNGPTLVVPGTHVLPHPEFDRALQPRQTAVRGPAGSVAVFFATIWHRGAANSTDAPRRAFFCYYRRADAIRIRGAPDPAPGEGRGLASAD
jgi:hypothetical protein